MMEKGTCEGDVHIPSLGKERKRKETQNSEKPENSAFNKESGVSETSRLTGWDMAHDRDIYEHNSMNYEMPAIVDPSRTPSRTPPMTITTPPKIVSDANLSLRFQCPGCKLKLPKIDLLLFHKVKCRQFKNMQPADREQFEQWAWRKREEQLVTAKAKESVDPEKTAVSGSDSQCIECSKSLSSRGNLKRHLTTCKAAALLPPVSDLAPQNSTKVPLTLAPQRSINPPMETMASVTYHPSVNQQFYHPSSDDIEQHLATAQPQESGPNYSRNMVQNHLERVQQNGQSLTLDPLICPHYQFHSIGHPVGETQAYQESTSGMIGPHTQWTPNYKTTEAPTTFLPEAAAFFNYVDEEEIPPSAAPSSSNLSNHQHSITSNDVFLHQPPTPICSTTLPTVIPTLSERKQFRDFGKFGPPKIGSTQREEKESRTTFGLDRENPILPNQNPGGGQMSNSLIGPIQNQMKAQVTTIESQNQTVSSSSVPPSLAQPKPIEIITISDNEDENSTQVLAQPAPVTQNTLIDEAPHSQTPPTDQNEGFDFLGNEEVHSYLAALNNTTPNNTVSTSSLNPKGFLVHQSNTLQSHQSPTGFLNFQEPSNLTTVVDMQHRVTVQNPNPPCLLPQALPAKQIGIVGEGHDDFSPSHMSVSALSLHQPASAERLNSHRLTTFSTCVGIQHQPIVESRYTQTSPAPTAQIAKTINSADGKELSRLAEPSKKRYRPSELKVVCPECMKVYASKRNANYHRGKMHKMTAEEIKAKPPQLAPPGAVISSQQRRPVAEVGVEAVTTGCIASGPTLGTMNPNGWFPQYALPTPCSESRMIGRDTSTEQFQKMMDKQPMDILKSPQPPILPRSCAGLTSFEDTPPHSVPSNFFFDLRSPEIQRMHPLYHNSLASKQESPANKQQKQVKREPQTLCSVCKINQRSNSALREHRRKCLKVAHQSKLETKRSEESRVLSNLLSTETAESYRQKVMETEQAAQNARTLQSGQDVEMTNC